MPKYETSESLDAWLRGNDRGISSNTIVQHLTGFPALGSWAPSHPHDPDDLGRCIRLLTVEPELRRQLWRMRSCSPVWAALVDRWDELAMHYIREAAKPPEGTCKTYELMRDIIDPLEAGEMRDGAELRRQLREIKSGGEVRMKIPAEGVSKEVLEALGAKVIQSNTG